MKKLIICFLAVALCLSRCASKPTKEEKTSKLSIVATNFPAYDFTREICGENAEVTMLLKPGAESHTYEPTPQDILKIQNCDLFVYTGGESDAWVDKLLGSIDTSKIKLVKMMDSVDIVEEEVGKGMEDTEESEEKEYDEHVWTSPLNAIKIVKTLKDELVKKDSKHQVQYEESAKSYIASLQKLDKDFRDVVKTGKRHAIVVGDRFPLRYLVNEYNIDYFAAFPGCASEAEPSAATVSFLIDEIRKEKIPVVFYIELSNEKLADTLCEATGAKKLLLHSCHNVSADDFEKGTSYIKLMEQNVVNMKEALH